MYYIDSLIIDFLYLLRAQKDEKDCRKWLKRSVSSRRDLHNLRAVFEVLEGDYTKNRRNKQVAASQQFAVKLL